MVPMMMMLVLLVALGVAAWLWGNDSRDGRDWIVRSDTPNAPGFMRDAPRPRPETQSVDLLDEDATTPWQGIHGETNR
jgi:hypothetical protein